MDTKAQRHYRYNQGAVSGEIAFSPRACALWAAALIALVTAASYVFS